MKQNDPKQLWEAALGELQLVVTRSNYETWLKNTVGLDSKDSLFVVGVPSAFVAEGLEKRMCALVQQTLTRLLKRPVDVRFQVTARDASGQRRAVVALSSEPPEGASTATSGLSHLNPRYRFETFVVGPPNRLAYAAARDVSEAPGRTYNPLYIYGEGGLGKTHLLQASARYALQQGRQVLYLSAEQFTNDFVNALQHQRIEAFRRRFTNLDLLVVDDIQFLGGKQQTQSQFFHLFNELYQADKQIILASDQPPRNLGMTEKRLTSRLQGGLIADIQAPDKETRIAILQAKAAALGLPLLSNVLDYISLVATTSVRELEGALARVAAHIQLTGAPLTLKTVQKVLQELQSASPPLSTSAESLLAAVAHHFNISQETLTGTSKEKLHVLARHIAMYLLRKHTSTSLAAIGKGFGKNANSVHYAIRHIETSLQSDPTLKQHIFSILRSLSTSPSAQSA
jgi:chromosomal replication initiator protein